MSSSTSPAVLLMAKAPRPGRTKTRLRDLLGPAGCARLQQRLIIHSVGVARRVAPERTYLAVDPPEAVGELATLLDNQVRLLPQVDGDLGERLAAASDAVFDDTSRPLLVTGTDIPTLDVARLNEATAALRQGSDAVFGPALDGGYYLLGVREPHPELFALPSGLWGGCDVLAASLNAARAAGLSVRLLSALRDLDTPADATALLADPALPGEIAELLRLDPAPGGRGAEEA